MKINKFQVSHAQPPYIVAELSANHDNSLTRALATVEAAAKCGVNAIKLQTYTPDTLTLNLSDPEFMINDPESLWQGRSLYELYQRAHTPWEWHEPIMRLAREFGLDCFSTPFDDTAVDFLESLDVPCYKVASFEIVDIPLIEKIASTGKPMIISTGMATVSEIEEAVYAARTQGCSDLALLKCSSVYPAAPAESNIRTIPHMRELFGLEVGLSDHTPGIGVAIAAVVVGASIIEKHFTLSRGDSGIDGKFSLVPGEMASLVIEAQVAWRSLGNVMYGPTTSENSSRKLRRSLYTIKDIKKGESLSGDNFRSIRPGQGLAPKHVKTIIGKRVNADLPRGTALTWDVIS